MHKRALPNWQDPELFSIVFHTLFVIPYLFVFVFQSSSKFYSLSQVFCICCLRIDRRAFGVITEFFFFKLPNPVTLNWRILRSAMWCEAPKHEVAAAGTNARILTDSVMSLHRLRRKQYLRRFRILPTWHAGIEGIL